MRIARRLTVERLAAKADLTKGQLSKIENGMVSSPLSTLERIARALRVELDLLIKRHDGTACHILPKKQLGARFNDIDEADLHYDRLFKGSSFDSTFEPMIGRLRTEKDFETYRYPGSVYWYVLRGSLVFGFGDERYTLKPGDSLYCDGRVEHGPVKLIKPPVDYILVLSSPRV